jgi:serine/threonine protein phosphatase PrpC
MFENVTHFEKSDIGLRRHNNEDSYLVVDQHCTHHDLQKFGMSFVIADGLGGHAAGEIASKMACEETVSAYYSGVLTPENSGDEYELKLQKLEKALRSAHNKIVDFAKEHGELRGMGTTLSALVLSDGKALIAHVGDSRIYRFRNHSCERMTVDHTENQLLIDTGKILPEQESNHCYRHIITQTLGGGADLTSVFTKAERVRRGDRFLLCTDGLHDLVTDNEIERILAEHPSPQAISVALVNAAIRKGGNDNVTVIIIQT